MSAPLPSPEEIWERLEQTGEATVFQRIDQGHPGNFYAALDARRRRGIVIISKTPPAEIPDLENLEIDVSEQQDGRWRTCIWVESPELQNLFTSLVQDILAASRTLPDDKIAEFATSRIVRWRELLASGSAALRLWEVRGLAAELIVLVRLCEILDPVDAVDAWHGPLGAPQDFVFQRSRIEAKAVGPTAKRIRITSAEQLDVPGDVSLRLVEVILSDVDQQAPIGFTIDEVVTEVQKLLERHPSALQQFSARLANAGLQDIYAYPHFRMRLDGLRTFAVEGLFPRIVPAMLTSGVSDVAYSVEVSQIGDFERAFGQ